MNRSIIFAAVIISVAILLNGYLERVTRAPIAPLTAENKPSTPREKSIAVLPFTDLTDQNVGFADGIQQAIISQLTKIHDLKLAGQSAVMRYKPTATRNIHEIGQQLGVANLLEGSVQREGNRVRVNIQLVDAKTDAHLWADTFDRELTDVFAIESEIAKTIADQLGARLSSAEEAAIAADSHP